jgi:hypothetical protein
MVGAERVEDVTEGYNLLVSVLGENQKKVA